MCRFSSRGQVESFLNMVGGEVERERRIAAEFDRLCNNAAPSLKRMCDEVVESAKKGNLDTAEEALNKLKTTEAVKVEAAQTMSQPRVDEAGAVGNFCPEYQSGVIPLAGYTVVGRGDFSGLPERVLEIVEERHFAVYYRVECGGLRTWAVDTARM